MGKRSIGRGRLDLSPAPARVQARVFPDAVQMQCVIEDCTGLATDLTVTDNRRSMVTVKKSRGRVIVRAHHMFVSAPEQAGAAIAELAIKRSPQHVRAAKAVLQKFTRLNAAQIRRKRPKRRIRLRTQGKHHNLQHYFDGVLRESFSSQPPPEQVRITWGRWGKTNTPLRQIRLGSYDPRRQLIRIHPILDRSDVPAWAVRFVIFHELLHHFMPSRRRRGRVEHHGPEFLRVERAHPDYAAFEAWMRGPLEVLMRTGG